MVGVCRVHFLLLLSGISLGHARRNVTIDSSNPMIYYSPNSSWSRIVGNLDAGGEHRMTQDPNAYALINLTFISYWVMSAKWPYHVTTQYTVDGNQTFVVDLQDHTVPAVAGGSGSKNSSIVASYIGTSELRHTIRISIPPQDKYAIVDRLIFEVGDNTSSTSSLGSTTLQRPTTLQTVAVTMSPTINSTTTSSGDLYRLDKAKKLTIIFWILGPLLALAAVLVFVYLYFRRLTTKKQPDSTRTHLSGDGMVNKAENDISKDVLPSSSSQSTNTGSYATTPDITPVGPYPSYDYLVGGFSQNVTQAGFSSVSFSPDRTVRTRIRPQPF